MKKIIALIAFACASAFAFAQEAEKPLFDMNEKGFMSTPKVGAYIIGAYKYSDLEGAHDGTGFGCRLIRAYVDGSIYNDFKYRVQLQFGGGNPHIKDFWVEWAKYKFFSVKMGQFKRAFTFENPMNPWDVGVGDYSVLVQKFAGMGDRLGEANMGGRDLGAQIQGDLLPIGSDSHALFHYQLGVWNGQGINQTDLNAAKDVIGTFQVQPIAGLWLGAFAWKGNWVKAATLNTPEMVFKRERLSYGVKFDKNNWTFRSEYAHNIAGEKKETGKSDAFYATAGLPLLKWFKLYLKWDNYRDVAVHNMYSAAANFKLHKNLNFQLEYRRHNNKFMPTPNYNEVWLQTYIRW